METLSPALADVVGILEATQDLTPAAIAQALSRPVTIDDVAPWIRFEADNYVRSLVTRSDRWELRLLCWRPGQTSSLHGHAGSACAFRILRGTAVESVLGERDRMWAPGDVVQESSSGLIHQVGNPADDPLLTLHAYSPALPVDAPSKRQGREIVVIGGGLSGVATAIHLLRRAGPDLRVTVVEQGPWLGRGIAYGVDSQVFRLNVPAASMSLDPENPGDFVSWAGVEQTPRAFLSRARFGEYVVRRFGDALRASRGKLRVVRGEAIGVDGDRVQLANGTKLPPAEVVVIATGISPRIAPSVLPTDPRIIDAWDECALATLPATGNVLIIGSGLSAIDVTTLLDARGFAGTATIISRNGLLPRPHLSPPVPVTPLAHAVVRDAPRNLRGLLRWGRAVVREAERRNEPWQHGIDAMRPHVSSLWQGLPPADRARFVRSARPFWNVLRHRAPADALALLEAWSSQGRLQILAGTVTGCVAKSTGLEVSMRLQGAATRSGRYDAMVRCIGPTLEGSEADSPLVRGLLAAGRASLDPAGLGIVTDADGRIVDAAGRPSDTLLAIGALRRASSWETTAVPDISQHALAIAKRLLP